MSESIHFTTQMQMVALVFPHCYFSGSFISVEGLKAVEIEKCKKDISDIKDQIWTAQKKFVDYNRMR